MKTFFLFPSLLLTVASFSMPAFAQDGDAASSVRGATTIYRQVLPDGRVVYSDKAAKGARLDQTITVEPPIKGNLWTTELGTRPVAPQTVEWTNVQKVVSVPTLGRQKTLDEATLDVIRAEMLLEDARKKQQAGVEPLPEERMAAGREGKTRVNNAYQRRQDALAREVAEAEAMLRKAIEERRALR